MYFGCGMYRNQPQTDWDPPVVVVGVENASIILPSTSPYMLQYQLTRHDMLSGA